MMTETFPVHDNIDTIRGRTIFKSEDWWKAALTYENHGQQRVGIYLWQQDGGDWKRRQKYVIRSSEDWQRDRDAVESLVQDFSDS